MVELVTANIVLTSAFGLGLLYTALQSRSSDRRLARMLDRTIVELNHLADRLERAAEVLAENRSIAERVETMLTRAGDLADAHQVILRKLDNLETHLSRR